MCPTHYLPVLRSTPGAHFFRNGEQDPFNGIYNKDTAPVPSLIDVDSTEIINNAKIEAGIGIASIVVLTKLKELIRWRSSTLNRYCPEDKVKVYDKERAYLPMGSMTDYELANYVYLYADELDKKDRLLEAAKVRLNWLDKKIAEIVNVCVYPHD